MKSRVLLTAFMCLGLGGTAWAQHDKYDITPDERTACQSDATLLCSYTYPDEDQLIDCMRKNRDQLSKLCLKAFDAGLRRRHLS